MKKKCRHSRTWLVCAARLEWCYWCGAIRQLKVHVDKRGLETNFVYPVTHWLRPTGINGKNPNDFTMIKKKEILNAPHP